MVIKQAIKSTYLSFKNEGSFANNIKYYTLYFFVTFLVQLVFTPIIARVFTAEAYGTFTLVASLATYASVVFTLQLEPAIVVQRTEAEARLISRAIFTISLLAFALTFLILAGVFAIDFFIGHSFSNATHFLWVPLLAILIAAHNVYGNVANRSKNYKKIYHVMSPTYLGSKLVTIGWGKFLNNNFFGLYLGEVLFRLAAVVLGFRYIIGQKLSTHFSFLSLSRTYAVAKANSNYIFYELPLRVISLLSSQMPIYFLAIYYNVTTVGQFAFANAFLEIPVRLISYSFATVFFQKSSEVINAGGTMFNRTLKMLGGLFLLAIPPFLILYFFSDRIFSFLFGDQWGYAAELAVSLVLFYFSRFVFEPFQVLFRVLGKQRVQFIATIIYFIIFGTYLFFSMSKKAELTEIFRVMSVLSLVFFILQTVVILQLLRKKA